MKTLLVEKEALLKRLAEIDAELAKPQFDPEKFLQGFFNNYVSKTDREKYPGIRFFGFDLDGNYLFEYDEKNNVFWLSYEKIWAVLDEEMGWNYAEIQAFCKKQVENHFKFKGVTTM